jgi:hypothetical protein
MTESFEVVDLTKTVRYDVAWSFGDERKLIRIEGLLAFVDRKDDRWELSGTPPNEAENVVLLRLVAESGTLDTTTVTVTPPVPK